MTSRIPVTAAGIASVHHRPIAMTATASTRCPAVERPAGVGRAIRTTANPAMKTVIPSARHSPFTAFGPLSRFRLFSFFCLDSMGIGHKRPGTDRIRDRKSPPEEGHIKKRCTFRCEGSYQNTGDLSR